MDGFAADLVVGVEEGLGEQCMDVAAAQAVEDAPAVSSGVDQAGQAELGQMLAGDGLATVGGGSERGDVLLAVTHCPQHPDAGRVAEQRESERGLVDLIDPELVRMLTRVTGTS